MEYRSHKKHKQNRLFFTLLIAGGALILLYVLWRVAFSGPWYGDVAGTFFSSRRALVSHVTALKLEEEKMHADGALLQLLADENEKLKKELKRETAGSRILATVLFPPGRSLYDTFVIDAGSEEGITEGARVYGFGSVAIGTVSKVDTNTATVLLYSSAGRETSGTMVESDIAVTLIGRGGGEYEIRMPREVHFEVGQVVSLQSTTPAIFATIEKISTDPRDPFQRLLAKAPINLQNLKWVVVE